MDLTIPYTFYPLALPGWIAWILFLIAIAGGAWIALATSRRQGWRLGIVFGVIGLLGLIAVTMVASMIITFVVYDL
jgi:hypothetical protein